MKYKTFNEVVKAAIADLTEHGFDSISRLQKWQREITYAAERESNTTQVDERLKENLGRIFNQQITKGGILKRHKLAGWKLESIKPSLRNELDRRIMASAQLIKLNREAMIQKTLQRFAGWSTSLPMGGSDAVDKRAVAEDIKKSFKALPYEERRCAIDQSHKLKASLDDIVSKEAGAIAGIWHCRHSIGYSNRESHISREGNFYFVRDSWAMRDGFIKLAGNQYMDEITAPAQEVYCFPGDSKIILADGVNKAYRRWYSGDLSEIITSTGKTLRGTFNHPVLTITGWKAIGLIKEGDEVIELVDEAIELPKKHQDDGITTIAEIFGTLNKLGVVKPFGIGIKDFHGDGTDGNVDIVFSARPLTFGRVSVVQKILHQLNLTEPNIAPPTVGALNQFRFFCLSASSGFLSITGQLFASVLPKFNHAQSTGIGIAFNANASFCEPTSNRCAGIIKLFRKFQNTISRLIKFDQVAIANIGSDNLFGNFFTNIKTSCLNSSPKSGPVNIQDGSNFIDTKSLVTQKAKVVKVNKSRFSGHVYNLQTKDGWYVTEGIITHNCSCSYEFLYSVADLPSECITVKGRELIAR